jgi:hypothetical protein
MRCSILSLLATMLGTLVAPLSGQSLLDWAIRSSAGADAVVLGVPAVFWNPAGVSAGAYKAEGMLISMRTPDDAVGLTGIAGAIAARLERITIGASYTHFGIDEITRTESSPVEATDEFSLGEDHFGLAASLNLSPALTFGASARYVRDNLDETDEVIGLAAGFLYRKTAPVNIRLGAYAMNEADEIAWNAGAQLELPAWLGPSYRLAASYGLSWVRNRASSDSNVDEASLMAQRGAVNLEWRERASVSAGLAREGRSEEADWEPVLAATLRFNRYTLGVVRETLTNGLGATYSFRLQLGIGP